jgi:hypothetical protein
VTDARWRIGNVKPKNLSMFRVKSATMETDSRRIYMYDHISTPRSSLKSSLDQEIVDNIRTGWVMVTTTRSKQVKTRIIKWHSFFRSCDDLLRLIITTAFRKIPATMKKTFTRHRNSALTKVFGSIVSLVACGYFLFFALKPVFCRTMIQGYMWKLLYAPAHLLI